MTTPINLTELREWALTNRHDDPDQDGGYSDILLALIDTAEAAIELTRRGRNPAAYSREAKRLRETLTRYTTNQP